jgi:hypothetical protein
MQRVACIGEIINRLTDKFLTGNLTISEGSHLHTHYHENLISH